MKVGTFNIGDYLDRLYEESSSAEGGLKGDSKEGIIIPEENKKAFSWLKREYDKGKVEVKVEMKLGNSKFEPGYDLQTNLKSVKDFKTGMFGEVKTSENSTPKKENKLETKDEANDTKEKKESTEKKSPVIGAKVKTTDDSDEDKNEKKDKKGIKEQSYFSTPS